MPPHRLVALLLLATLAPAAAHASQAARLVDFQGDTRGWKGNREISDFHATPDGIVFRSGPNDPWIEGPPPSAMPVDARVRLRMKIRSSKVGAAQIYFGRRFSDGSLVHLPIPKADTWIVTETILPPQESGSRLRIDPPTSAECSLAWIDAQPLRPLFNPRLPACPPPPAWPGHAPSVAVDPLQISQHPTVWSALRARIDGIVFAETAPAERVVFLLDGTPTTIDLDAHPAVTRTNPDGSLESTVTPRDPGGATWTCTRRLRAMPERGAVAVEVSFEVDRDREIVHLPWITLLPGKGTFGTRKTQALLPGVEYLADEPSSSEAEVEGEAADRRIPADFRLCTPMMSVVHNGRYVALAWDRDEHPAPVFDSPDRILHSDAHLLGLWEPPVGPCRLEHDLGVYDTFRLHARKPRRSAFTIFGGRGTSAVDAIRHYVQSHPLPPLPQPEGDLDGAVRLLSAGWTRSKIREGGLFRHAFWGDNFRPQPAADAAACMSWLATRCTDPILRDELAAARTAALDALPPTSRYQEDVSHVRRPLTPLLFGRVPESIDHRLDAARKLLASFDPSGILRYRPQRDRPDYARTLGAEHANGFAAIPLETILETATLTGDPSLRRDAIALLDRQTVLYADSVPRGAQPWEMPLHTPDILASARLARCYVLGHLLTGERRFLEQARYWAWTGLAMVYLDPPVQGAVGSYATIGVIGATNWRAPNWIGQPVQWCGLVYRSALLDLAGIDPDNAPLWRRVATGITRAGLQMSFPLSDPQRQGLLPDYFLLREQISDGPAINPGTVGAGLPEAYDQGRLYDCARLRDGAIVHAPGAISKVRTDHGSTRFHVDGWPSAPYHILIVSLPRQPAAVQWSGQQDGFASHHVPRHHALILTARGPGDVTLR